MNFGNLARSAPAQTKTITIVRGDGPPINPSLGRVMHRNVSAQIKEIEPGERYELTTTIAPPWPRSRVFRYAIPIKPGIDDVPEDRVNLIARVLERFSAMPNRIMVPSQMRGDRIVRVRLMWTGGPPGKVTSASSNDDQIKVDLRPHPTQPAVLVTIPKGYEFDDNKHPVVTVNTDDPDAPNVVIPIYDSARRAIANRPLAPARLAGPPAPRSPQKN